MAAEQATDFAQVAFMGLSGPEVRAATRLRFFFGLGFIQYLSWYAFCAGSVILNAGIDFSRLGTKIQ